MAQNNYGLPYPLTEQTIFDKVAAHLIQQGRQSVVEDGAAQCMYRGFGGTACAVGCLINDARYTDKMEYRLADRLSEQFIPELKPFIPLLTRLQRVHDSMEVVFRAEEISDRLRNIAMLSNLSPNILDALKPSAGQPWSPPKIAEQTLPVEITRLLGSEAETVES